MTDNLLPFKWFSKRVCPTSDGQNAHEIEYKAKFKIDTLCEYVEKELEVQKRIFVVMGCDPSLSKKALKLLKECYMSSSCEDSEEVSKDEEN